MDKVQYFLTNSVIDEGEPNIPDTCRIRVVLAKSFDEALARESTLVKDLASEKILSKTMRGQKETYMMLADKSRLDLSESKASEAALREELATQDRVLRSSCPEHFSASSPVGTAQNYIGELERSLTVAEQRAGELEGLLREAYEAGDQNIFGTGLDSRIDAALKPAAEGE